MNSIMTANWTPPLPADERNYPMNCWWVAALCDEVGDALLGRWLCDTPVVLYRKQDGTIAALEDRCPHRSAPLSLGCRKGDAIECGYHGFTFADDGSCIRVPTMNTPPSAMRVRTFPVIESFPFVWIYLGDPAKLTDVPALHKLDWASDPAFAKMHGRIDIDANFMLLKENVLDLTHFGFVHAKTFKITDWVEAPRLTGEGDVCGFHQSFTASPLPPVFGEPLGLKPGTPYDRENYGSFVSPAIQIAAVDLIEPSTKQMTGQFRICHATTPIDRNHMHYFWAAGRNYGTSPEEMADFRNLTERGFDEDKVIIEAIQKVHDRDPRPTDQLEKSVKSDGPSVQARRIMARWMARETA
jgi:vanillate O-demethylase monooxygenase subunit